MSSRADHPIPWNWLPQEASCGGALVAGGEAIATGAGESGRSATGCARPKGEVSDATPQVEEAPEPKGGKAAAGLAKGEGGAAWSAKCEKPVAAAGAEALAALPKGEAMANCDGRNADGRKSLAADVRDCEPTTATGYVVIVVADAMHVCVCSVFVIGCTCLSVAGGVVCCVFFVASV